MVYLLIHFGSLLRKWNTVRRWMDSWALVDRSVGKIERSFRDVGTMHVDCTYACTCTKCWDSTPHVDTHRRASQWEWTGPANQHPLLPVTGCSIPGTSGHDRIAVVPRMGKDYISLKHGFLVSSIDSFCCVWPGCERQRPSLSLQYCHPQRDQLVC